MEEKKPCKSGDNQPPLVVPVANLSDTVVIVKGLNSAIYITFACVLLFVLVISNLIIRYMRNMF